MSDEDDIRDDVAVAEAGSERLMVEKTGSTQRTLVNVGFIGENRLSVRGCRALMKRPYSFRQ